MGNYHTYTLENTEEIEIPDLNFEEKVSIIGLFSHKFCYSKRWDMIKDMCLLSAHYPKIIFIITSVDEDTEKLRRSLFLNGKVEVQLGKIVYPSIESAIFKEPLVDEWNFNSITERE